MNDSLFESPLSNLYEKHLATHGLAALSFTASSDGEASQVS
jgi:hypothetical protein